jgi:hypothetical protein
MDTPSGPDPKPSQAGEDAGSFDLEPLSPAAPEPESEEDAPQPREGAPGDSPAVRRRPASDDAG